MKISNDNLMSAIKRLTGFFFIMICMSAGMNSGQRGILGDKALPGSGPQDAAGGPDSGTYKAAGLGKNIDCIFQDRKGNYGFASNGDGVCRYDGRTIRQFTGRDGLTCNFVLDIQEDPSGNLWFTTRDGICSYDGSSFTDYTAMITYSRNGSLLYKKGGIFFSRLNGVSFFDGNSFTNFTIHPEGYKPEPGNMSRPYGVYCTLVDRAGNVWFGTQSMGVCRFDGRAFTWFDEKGLKDAAVRCMFQDRKGNLWFGNNGSGLFRYDGKTLVNFTDEKGLGNPDFLKKKEVKGSPGTLARVWAINEDAAGNLWIGTIDAGLWKYNGTDLINYTVSDGLTHNAIWTMYKDRKGDLLFVTGGEDVFRLNGDSFAKFAF